MLELLMTSHGSSASRGVKQGTGCSRGLRAIHIPEAGGQRQYGPKRGKERDEEEGQRKDKMEKK